MAPCAGWVRPWEATPEGTAGLDLRSRDRGRGDESVAQKHFHLGRQTGCWNQQGQGHRAEDKQLQDGFQFCSAGRNKKNSQKGHVAALLTGSDSRGPDRSRRWVLSTAPRPPSLSSGSLPEMPHHLPLRG